MVVFNEKLRAFSHHVSNFAQVSCGSRLRHKARGSAADAQVMNTNNSERCLIPFAPSDTLCVFAKNVLFVW